MIDNNLRPVAAPGPVNPKPRSQTFDLMRLLALIMIVFLHHMPEYYFDFYNLRRYFGIDANYKDLHHLMRYMGLGLFIFMSGYLLSAKQYPMTHWRAVMTFLGNRIFRIFPLYWITLVIFIYYIRPEESLGVAKFIMHVLGLQLFFDDPLPTIWFIGLITIYYLLFALIEFAAQKRDKLYYLFPLTFILLFVLKVLVPAMDTRLLVYWPIFIFGVWFARICPQISLIKFVCALVIMIVSQDVYFDHFKRPEALPMSFKFLVVEGLISVFMVSFVITVYYLCSKIRMTRVAQWVYWGAYSSFGVYLFHRPVFQITESLLGRNFNLWDRTKAFAIAIAVLFIIAFVIQKSCDFLVSSLKKRCLTAA